MLVARLVHTNEEFGRKGAVHTTVPGINGFIVHLLQASAQDTTCTAHIPLKRGHQQL